MAKIKGLSLKAFKSFTGEDGYGFNANLYLGTKKIGEANDFAHGGPLDVVITEESRKEEYDSILAEYGKEIGKDASWAEEYLISELADLTQMEKDYKKHVKKGYDLLICLEDNHEDENGNPKPVKIPKSFFATKNINLKKYEEEGYDNMTVYRSLDDFIKA